VLTQATYAAKDKESAVVGKQHIRTNLSQNFVTNTRKFVRYHLQVRRWRCGEGSRWDNFVAFVHGLSTERATVAV
jgi:hypothetical protein